jgi:S-adenosylmethionine synthetase
MGGLISPCRPYTMEGICGKNPVYHTGKMYSVAAFEIAEQLHKKLSVGSEVFLIGQSGQPLINPWKAIIQVDEDADENKIIEIYDEVISNPEKLTEKILSQSYIMA